MDDLLQRTHNVTDILDDVAGNLAYRARGFAVVGNDNIAEELHNEAIRVSKAAEEVRNIQGEFIGRLVKESRESLVNVFSMALKATTEELKEGNK